MSLDSFLQGKATEQAQGQDAAQATQDTVKAPEPATGEAAQAADIDGDAPDADAGDDKRVPLRALKDERKKRQELAEEVKELRKRLDYYQPHMQQQPAQQPQQEQWEWTEERVLQDLPGSFKRIEQTYQKHLSEWKYRASEEVARDRYDDYDDVIKRFPDVIKENPALHALIDRSDMPALTAYKAIKKHVESKKQPADIDALVEQKVQQRLAELQQKPQTKPAALPVSLTNARGSGAATPKATSWAGPKPLGAIVGRK